MVVCAIRFTEISAKPGSCVLKDDVEAVLDKLKLKKLHFRTLFHYDQQIASKKFHSFDYSSDNMVRSIFR